MITTDFIIALPIGAIIGWIIREVVSDRLARERTLETIKITEFNKAAAIFHAAFVALIVQLRRNIQTAEFHYTNIPTNTDFADHERAKIIFEPYLPADRMAGFNDAWDRYINCRENYIHEFKPTEQPDSISIEAAGDVGRHHRKQYSQYCLTHLHALLKYAKPTI